MIFLFMSKFSENSGEKAVFGYGSLILPTSLVGRFVDLEEDVDSIYEQNLGLDDEGLIREEAEKAWEGLKDEIEVIPVKIPGFSRKYSYESHRGGAMLEAEPLLDQEDYAKPIEEEFEEYVNGLVVLGLDEGERDQIASTEDGYKRINIHQDNIVHYLDDTALEDIDADIPEHIEVYISEDETDKFDKDTNRLKNETYHARVLKGIQMLGELFGDDVAEEFYGDFLDSTYEKSALTEEDWIETSYNDALKYFFEEDES